MEIMSSHTLSIEVPLGFEGCRLVIVDYFCAVILFMGMSLPDNDASAMDLYGMVVGGVRNGKADYVCS